MNEPCSDPVVERVVALLRSRSATGLRKYGVTLADSKLSRADFLRHLHEELLDAANYVQALRDLEASVTSLGLETPPSPPAPPKGYPPGW